MMRFLSILFLSILLLPAHNAVYAADTDAATLFYKMRERLGYVKDYVAEVRMKIDVSFMRIPTVQGKLYFKAPDKLKLERNGGIAILPKKNINLTLSNLVPSGNTTVIDAGYDIIDNQKVRIIKVVPEQEQNDIVLTKIWIDEAHLLALRTETTTRDNGTIKMDLRFGKYADVALPDKVIFYIDVKEYKLPKGVTMDYDGNENIAGSQTAKGSKARKGKIQIEYLSYIINKGIPDEIFAEKAK